MTFTKTQDERQIKVEQFIKIWFDGFERDLSNDQDKQRFLSAFAPSIVWTDHAFYIQRSGFDAVMGLQRSFTHCNQPFKTEVKAFHHISSGAVVEVVWIGRCANDIVRPDGQIAVKAHGKDFAAHVCFVLEVDPGAGISKIDEYYTKIWEDGVPAEKYHRITGASIKS